MDGSDASGAVGGKTPVRKRVRVFLVFLIEPPIVRDAPVTRPRRSGYWERRGIDSTIHTLAPRVGRGGGGPLVVKLAAVAP